MPTDAAGERRAAWAAGLACYLIWGFVPLAMQVIAAQGPGAWEILSHRILWGAIAAGVFVLAARQGRQVLRVLREPGTMGWLALSSLFIAINWVVFIWAVNESRVLQTSLGYYINPLVNVAAGALFFRERLDRIAWAAIALAAAGVAFQALALGALPWVSLVLAFSFGGYGVVRKRVAADAQAGLFIECLVMAAPCLAYVLWLESRGAGHFTASAGATFWLIASGPITAVPLALFAWAARRLPLSAMGFLQFLAPTIGFLTGVVQGEAFSPLHAVSFGFIWAGAATFLFGAVRAARRAYRLA